MGEDEAGQREEELDPEIAARGDQVEQPHARIMMPLAVMIEHDQQWRQRARARQRRDGGRLALAVACFHPAWSLTAPPPSVMVAGRKAALPLFAFSRIVA